LVEKAEEGELAAIREIADRLDGKAPQAVEVGDVPFDRLTDAQLNAIAAAGLPDTDMMPKALPPPRKFSQDKAANVNLLFRLLLFSCFCFIPTLVNMKQKAPNVRGCRRLLSGFNTTPR
jgi:hypothetical protein